MVADAAPLTDDLRLLDDRAGVSGVMVGREDSEPAVSWSNGAG